MRFRTVTERAVFGAEAVTLSTAVMLVGLSSLVVPTVIPVPETEDFVSPLITVLPLQLLAYQAGLKLGRDVDKPRNLAKSVTVE